MLVCGSRCRLLRGRKFGSGTEKSGHLRPNEAVRIPPAVPVEHKWSRAALSLFVVIASVSAGRNLLFVRSMKHLICLDAKP